MIKSGSSLIMFAFLVMLLWSCEKDSGIVETGDLIGTWKLEETYISPGGATEWMPVEEEAKSIISFLSENTYSSSNWADCAQGSYHLDEQEELISFERGCGKETLEFYFVLKKNELILNYSRCIEPCQYKYIRQLMSIE